MSTMQVEVVNAEAALFSGKARFLTLPGEMGQLGVLPGHTPFITRIKPGIVHIHLETGDEELIFVAGGILEVQPYITTVLADTAMRGHDIDEAKALEAKRIAEENMANRTSDIDFAKAQSEFAVAAAQLAAIAKLRKKR